MKCVIIVLALILSPMTMAGDGHNHEAAVEPAPHGGILRDAHPYKAELVLEGDNARVYVYDKGLKIAEIKAQTLEGSIRLPKQKKDTKVTFKREGDSFNAKLAGVDKVHRFDLHIYLTEGGQKTKLDFGIDNIH
jgi:hypothetical protein